VPIVLKFGSLNLLEPSGPVQACNGTVLPYPIHCKIRELLKHGPYSLSTNESGWAVVLRQPINILNLTLSPQVIAYLHDENGKENKKKIIKNEIK
jgi:hypothetical protein